MFKNLSEASLMKIYDWITHTFYNSDLTWNQHDTDERTRAIHALNDMRALFSGVGNNGWWDVDRVYHLEDLQDITSYSMDQVLLENAQLINYYKKREEAQEKDDFDWHAFVDEHAPEIEKMQGNADGKLYEYAKVLFWDSVESFLNRYATNTEMSEIKALIKQERETPEASST